MAQTKNTFIKSRMNKDLDDRLVPNGEYREALNVEVSQSEGADVGTVSASLGNLKITDFDLSNDCEAKIIGVFPDERNKSVYVFITNFVDTSNDKLSNFASGSSICQIWRRNIETNVNTKLVDGDFLNFSLTHHILNINLLEDLLFWTDNRNQPRKINIVKANPSNSPSPTYYTSEDQVSVAKYYPFEPIELLNNYLVDFSISNSGTGVVPGYTPFLGKVVPTRPITGSGSGLTVLIDSVDSFGRITSLSISTQGFGYENGDEIGIDPPFLQGKMILTVETQSTMKDKCTEFLPSKYEFTQSTATTITSGAVATNITGVDFALAENTFVKITTASGTDITPAGKARCTFPTTVQPTITWNSLPNTLSIPQNAILTFGVNPDYDPNWPGDCEFLKDKFVRFAYRFKFEDNEYSLISPFTQACFIPRQNGYFLSQTRSRTTSSSSVDETIYDSQLAYESTDLGFFENAVNSVDLKIPAPSFLSSPLNNLFKDVTSKMHIKEIDIIYKDDSENVLKIVDTIPSKDFKKVNSNFIIYSYQSKAPIKTLPSNEITRVSDKVPVKSLTQEISGNRIIYGNYIDNHTSNKSLNYEIAAAEKTEIIAEPPVWLFNPLISKEYQNHTLKQNRNYQVGIVLSDRYGRQSDVIMSSLGESSTSTLGSFYQGSTLFHPFYPGDPGLINQAAASTWNGDDLKVKFNSRIPESTGQTGYPGLFIDYDPPLISNFLSTGDYKLSSPQTNYGTTVASPSGGVGLTVDFTLSNPADDNGFITNISINNPGAGYENGDVITIPGNTGGVSSSTFVLAISNFPNLTGWYSYKIVVKQQEQDYYNVYLPGIVNGAINEEGVSSSTKATISLYGDNINKVPKDLLDVGPSQTNYRSDTKLSLRVENTSTSSKQYYPGTDIEDVVLLSELTDLGINLDRTSSLSKAGIAAPMPGTVELQSINDKIKSGMSVTVIDNSGNVIISQSEGAYVFSYYVNGNGKGIVEIRGTNISIDGGSTLTFGPAGIIFNAGNNPIIGILSTSDTIGVAEENDFSTKLAVFETKPTKSLLDVFFETTSSGLISTLNQAILAGTTSQDIPVSISAISFIFDESLTGSQTCTNSFNANNIINTAITVATTTCEILSVRDLNGADRSSEFDVIAGANAGFTLRTTKPVGEGYYVSSSISDVSFIFTIEMSNQGVSTTKKFNGIIANKEPQYIIPIPPNVNSTGGDASNTDPYISSKEIDSIVPNRKFKPNSFPPGFLNAPFPGFKALNGSGDTALNKKDLTWDLISCIPIDGEDEPFNYNTQVVAANGQITNLAFNSDVWPTIIRTADSITNADPLKSYQIEIGREYVNENKIALIPGSSVTNNNGTIANASSSIAPSLTITDDEALIYVFGLNGSIPATITNVDAQDSFGQFILNFLTQPFQDTTTYTSTNITIDVAQVVKFVTWECKFRVTDGGNFQASDITVQIKQT